MAKAREALISPQDNVYYSYKERSFEPAFARAQGEEVRLTGGAGDGYCFDTNSIHAGELSGLSLIHI